MALQQSRKMLRNAGDMSCTDKKLGNGACQIGRGNLNIELKDRVQ